MKDDLWARVTLMQELLAERDLPRAVEETLWLWRNWVRLDPQSGSVKHTLLQVVMLELCMLSPSAHSVFAAERDATLQALEKRFDAETALELITLCNALGEEPAAWSWFEREQARLPRDFQTYQQVSLLLSAAGRWAALGQFVGAALAMLEASHQGLAVSGGGPWAGQSREQYDRGRDMMLAAFRAGAAILVRALRAAGRGEEAMAVHTRALQLDDSTAMRKGLGGGTAEA